MTEIKIHVQHKHPVIIGEIGQIVTDNTDYAMKFTFDSDWEDGPKNVLFVLDDGYAFAPVTTEDNIAKVPKIVDDKIRTLYVGVQQGDVKTTLPCTLRVFPSIAQMVKDDVVQPDPSMWEFVIHKLDELEKNGGGESPGGSVQIDATLTKQGYAADAKAVGDALVGKINKQQGIENAGKLMFVGEGGEIIPLALGAGLKIKDGVLMIVNAAVTAAICGQFKCGEVVCGGTK